MNTPIILDNKCGWNQNELRHIMTTTPPALKLSAQNGNHLSDKDFTKHCKVLIYQMYVLEGETDKKTFFKQDMEFITSCR